MHDELTKKDIQKMREELRYRQNELLPEQLEDVKHARSFGDLSENFEYKAAKQALNRNKGRIRYLTNMIKSARIIDDSSAADEVGLFDKVEIFIPEEEETEVYQVVTTVRCDPRLGLISKESPLGKELLGKKIGDRIHVVVNESYSYTAVVRSITKTEDDGSAPLMQY